MARRDGRLLQDLVRAPWWVSVLLAAVAYGFLGWVLPVIGPHLAPGKLGPFLLSGLSAAAPLVTLALLIPAPLAALRQWRERRLLDRQTGLDTIRELSWQDFETLVAEAYRRLGYAVERRGGEGPDGGIDLVLVKDGKCLVQCKQWRRRQIGVTLVRELFGLVTAEGAEGGILITSGGFTPEARHFARGKPIELVGHDRLARLVELGQRPQGSRSPETSGLRTQHSLSPGPDPAPICPSCSRRMVRRRARSGRRAGQEFWGCSGYPACRGLVGA